MHAQSLQVGTGPRYYPPNGYLAPTKQPLKILPELVHLFKSYSGFSKTQTHRWTDTQTNHPFTVYGYRLIFCPVFLPFHSLRLLALLPHSISFTIISFKSTLIKVISKWPATRFAATLTEKNNRPTRLKLAEFRKYLNFSNKKLKSYPGSTPTQCAGEPVTVEIVCTDQGQVHMLATTQPSPKCFF